MDSIKKRASMKKQVVKAMDKVRKVPALQMRSDQLSMSPAGEDRHKINFVESMNKQM